MALTPRVGPPSVFPSAPPIAIVRQVVGLDADHLAEIAGREVSIPLASKRKLYGFLNFRYLWETGVRNNLEGNMFLLTASFPIPSVSLQ